MGNTVKITFVDAEGGKNTDTTAPVGTTLLQAALDAGIDITATCGRRGRCRSCRIKVLQGVVPPPTVQDTIQLGLEAVREQFRLSCQTLAIADCRIMAAPVRSEVGHKILSGKDFQADGMRLDSGVAKHVVIAEAPADENHQTSDVEQILSQLDCDTDRRLPLNVLRKVPEILRKKKGQLTVTTFNREIIDIEPGDTASEIYGMAFDIGTTSIVGSLLNLETGEELASVANVNPQTVYGGDLMSRIAYAQFDPKKLATLRGRVLSAINDFIDQACEKGNVSPEHIYKIVVVGNTCMHHIFLGVDTSYVGLAPYAPTVRDPIVLPATEIPLKRTPNARVCFLPIVAGFVGADTIGAAIATRIYESDGIRVLVDIGTNGEIIMGSKDRLLACSAPAGPALEGGQIEHGMRGAMGAIEKVTIDDDVHCESIGGTPPIGICGSGLIDAVAKMLDADVLNAAGRLRLSNYEALPPALRTRFVQNGKARAFVLAWSDKTGKGEDIALTQIDIRQLQLAKGAIYSGILMLQKLMGVANEDIEEVLLCGGFGNYLSIESALRIRLLPDLPPEKITYMGNAAHFGAQIALLSETERNNAQDIARRIEHVALATRQDFQEIFIDACSFADQADIRALAGAG